MTESNVAEFFKYADGCIVGFGMKEEGHPEKPVDIEKVKRFMAAVETAR
jgi:predicted TIM-barrel enzyme